MPRLAVVIPARNEEGCIEATVRSLYATLRREEIDHEILVVDSGSTDATADKLVRLASEVPTLRAIAIPPPHRFGQAVRAGLGAFTGDAVAIFMADASETPDDLVRFWRTLWEEDVACVFGSRFRPTSKLVGYPPVKRVLNRLGNLLIARLFGLDYDDVSNAFKMYRAHVIADVQPLRSNHFDLTVELPLKAIGRGHSWTVVAHDWIERTAGTSKLALRRMAPRYLAAVWHCWLERGTARPTRRGKEIGTTREVR